jgi:hypothetical protein
VNNKSSSQNLRQFSAKGLSISSYGQKKRRNMVDMKSQTDRDLITPENEEVHDLNHRTIELNQDLTLHDKDFSAIIDNDPPL